VAHQTLRTLIEHGACDRPAIVDPDAPFTLSYRDLGDQVDRLAGQLAASGIHQTDRVAIALPNGVPAIVATLAASCVGTAAPLNPAYTRDEFRFYLGDTSAAALLVLPSGPLAAVQAAVETQTRVLIVDAASSVVRLDQSVSPASWTPPSPGGTAMMLHTSGSTGRPKRVPLTHEALAASAGTIADTYALDDGDVSLCVMPLFHVHGFVASTLATLRSGGTVVVPSRLTPLTFGRVLRSSRPTWYSAVPTLHQLCLVRELARSGGRSHELRFIRSCSAPLAPSLMRSLEAAFDVPVLEAYGMTEAAHQVASNPLPPEPRREGSVGRGTGVQIAVMDERGVVLEPPARGEVVLQGPTVIAGYDGHPDANAATFVDGWFKTGDIGELDDRGYLTLVGRRKELINRGGEKVSPREIEEVLLAHPAVTEAVCFGVPHEIWGEEIAAVVVARAPVREAGLIAFCGERLASFKLPKNIRVVREIPRTATGKILRHAVAAAYANL